ncbi:glycosyltransferase [Terriglobus roseus]|uniref:Glycosyltransferase Family 4 n=1 Tax=Terriglobus roseus TaxID=392734 RepID=A0A1G7J188_9BACT|nr:glycosyltransferase [Terriglobus roseus]SDF18628.1 Glycosyltransferase Family 4 [Terriglobus roseus]
MRIVQTVFGVFHHFDLARELHRRGHLERIYSTWPWQRIQREGLPHDKVRTFPWVHTPEFLMKRAGLLPRPVEDITGYLNALSFDEYTTRTLPDCDALIGISGSSLKAGRLLQQRGGMFFCDRGSSHQRYQEQIVSAEFRRWGVHTPVSDPRDTAREEEIYAMADGITVPSSFAARSFVEMGIPASKVHTIPYGVRLERFQPTGDPPKDRLEILFVGNVGLRKGVPYLLEAFARLRHPNKRLRIVGGMSREFPSVLERLPKEHVEFTGILPQQQVAEMMSRSHLLVLPSIEEGLALVQGQALACGCPVLATTNTGGEDLFHDEVEGFIVPIRDVDALTNRMERIAQDPALQQRLRAAGLERVKHIGGWETYGDRWETLLQNSLAGRR